MIKEVQGPEVLRVLRVKLVVMVLKETEDKLVCQAQKETEAMKDSLVLMVYLVQMEFLVYLE